MSSDEFDPWRQALERAAQEHAGAGLDIALAGLGWEDALVSEPRLAIPAVFEAQGRHNCVSAALDAVLGARPGQGAVLPGPGVWGPPGTVVGAELEVTGVARRPASCSGWLVSTLDGEVVVPPDALDPRTVSGMDPDLGLVGLRGLIPAAAVSPGPGWPARLAAGRLALGYELVGCGRGMLALARSHSLERLQFGRPISAFQAVRHRLAETLVALEGAEALLEAAWDEPDLAVPAKALAGSAARTAARHCQQVLGGIGFTAEHRFHRFLRRALVLDQLLGGAGPLTRELGRSVLESGRLPAPLAL